MSPVINMGFSEFIEDNVKELTESMEWMKDREMKLISKMPDVSDYIDKAIERGICALDLETNGLNTRVDKEGKPIGKIAGFCLSYDPKVGVYMPLGHLEEPSLNLPEKELLVEIKRLCANCVTVYYNSKFDTAYLKNYGIFVPKVFVPYL